MDEMQDIRPQLGDESVPIPLTLDVQRQVGAERFRGRIYLVTGLIPLFFILDLVFLFASSWSIPVRLFVFVILIILEALFLRLVLLEERKFRKDLESAYKNDFKLNPHLLWGIFQISESPRPVLYFQNGLIGVLARFEKNVKVGRDTDAHRFEHYNSIAEALNYVGMNGGNVTYIDYMSSSSKTDERLQIAQNSLSKVENPDVKNLLSHIYKHLEESIAFTTPPVDMFLITYRGYEEDLWTIFNNFASNMLRANFVGYSLLDYEAYNELIKDTFGLTQFNVLDALKSSPSDLSSIFRPLKLISPTRGEINLRRRRS